METELLTIYMENFSPSKTEVSVYTTARLVSIAHPGKKLHFTVKFQVPWNGSALLQIQTGCFFLEAHPSDRQES